MAVYDINGATLAKVYAISGNELSAAYNISGARVFPDDGNDFILAHLSDTHADSTATNRILADISAYGTVDDIICTGDMVSNTAGSISSWWNPKVLTCIGNHDSATYNSSTGYNWTALSMAQRDAYYISPFKQNWGVTHVDGQSYYYKDYASKHIRLIVMDTMLYMSDSTATEAAQQTAWLTNLLSGAIANGLHVIVATHAPYNDSPVVDCSFSRYGRERMMTLTDCYMATDVVEAIANAVGVGLNFVGYVVGHNHQDYIFKPNSTQTGFCVTCASMSKPQWQESDQDRSTLGDAYNIVRVDTEHTLVTITRRGGANRDNLGRKRVEICFNYSTGEMQYEVT